MVTEWGKKRKTHTVVHGALALSFYLAPLDQIQWLEPSFLRRKSDVSLILVPSSSVSNISVNGVASVRRSSCLDERYQNHDLQSAYHQIKHGKWHIERAIGCM